MIQLLKTDFVAALNKRKPIYTYSGIPNVEFEDIFEPQFDILDTKNEPVGTSIKQAIGAGNASYYNRLILPTHTMRFIKYEEFLDQFGLLVKGVNRADFIAYDISEERKYFIIHEVSKGKTLSKKPDFRMQFTNTVFRLLDVPRIKTFIDSFEHRYCIGSAGIVPQVSPLNMASAFNNAFSILPNYTKIKVAQVERKNFEAFMTHDVVLL